MRLLDEEHEHSRDEVAGARREALSDS
jgi:hypothetical protein